jgi:hypothetical protein
VMPKMFGGTHGGYVQWLQTASSTHCNLRRTTPYAFTWNLHRNVWPSLASRDATWHTRQNHVTYAPCMLSQFYGKHAVLLLIRFHLQVRSHSTWAFVVYWRVRKG